MKSMGHPMESQLSSYTADRVADFSVRLCASLTCVGGGLCCLTSADVVAPALEVLLGCGRTQQLTLSVTFMLSVPQP
jgi:Na+/H+-dicarboxylate symporter